MTDVADIIIIGSGASGAAAAWSLSKDNSLRIVCSTLLSVIQCLGPEQIFRPFNLRGFMF